MSWIRENTLSWTHSFFVRLLKCGKIPNHIAFIMDGNRRYARKNNIGKIEGHSKGFDKLSETLQWCLHLGISEVTVYAFSIENYRRTKEEVDGLMDLARQKFKRLLEEREKLMEKGVRIQIIGNKSLLPEDIVRLIAKVEFITRDNNKSLLNVAFSYTAQDEITYGVNTLLKGLNESSISENDLSLNLFSHCLYTKGCSYPEVIIRTSGETRLSDFLLFQGSCSYLYFTDVLWPELTAWDLLWAVFKYQNSCSTLEDVRNKVNFTTLLSDNSKKFLDSLTQQHLREITELVN